MWASDGLRHTFTMPKDYLDKCLGEFGRPILMSFQVPQDKMLPSELKEEPIGDGRRAFVWRNSCVQGLGFYTFKAVAVVNEVLRVPNPSNATPGSSDATSASGAVAGQGVNAQVMKKRPPHELEDAQVFYFALSPKMWEDLQAKEDKTKFLQASDISPRMAGLPMYLSKEDALLHLLRFLALADATRNARLDQRYFTYENASARLTTDPWSDDKHLSCEAAVVVQLKFEVNLWKKLMMAGTVGPGSDLRTLQHWVLKALLPSNVVVAAEKSTLQFRLTNYKPSLPIQIREILSEDADGGRSKRARTGSSV